MAKQRYISTSFWDDEWVQELDPSEKFLYIYLLTNPLTNIAGIYKITKRRIVFDTGFNQDTIEKILKRFSHDGKVHYRNNYMIITNWTKHQKLKTKNKDGEKPNNVKVGIDQILFDLEPDFLLEIIELGYQYVYMKDILLAVFGENYKEKIKALKGASRPSHYLDLNLNLNLDLNRDYLKEDTVEQTRDCEPEELVDNSQEQEELSKSSYHSTPSPPKKEQIPYKIIVDYLNSRARTEFKHTTRKTRDCIKARWREGFRLNDFTTVIERKCSEWLTDEKMVRYVRPPTLFGPKFESYLQQPDTRVLSEEEELRKIRQIYGIQEEEIEQEQSYASG